MKIKILLLLLIVSIGACTTSPNSTNSNDAQKWQQTITELNALLREKKHQKAIDEAQQKLSQLLAATANATIPNDTLAKYARQILNLSYFSYLGSKQFQPGIEYLDSISGNPFLQQYCKHELLSTRESITIY